MNRWRIIPVNKETADRLLEEARKSFQKRTRWHHRAWRWLRNLCPLCGAKLEIKFGAFNSIKTCSRCPNYRPYAGELNYVPILIALIAVLAVTILLLISMQKEKKAMDSGEIYREPAIRPRAGYFDGYR